MKTLARLVGDVEPFVRDGWGRLPAIRRGGSFTDLVTIDDIETVIADADWPEVFLVSSGSVVDLNAYGTMGEDGASWTIDLDRLLAQFNAGATITVASLHRRLPQLSAFVRGLARELGLPVQTNAYLSPPAARGLSTHADRHDIFAVGLAGSKHWRVFAPGEGSAPFCAIDLNPGNVLYIPCGWPHNAESTDQASAHLAVGVQAPTWADVISRVVAPLGRSAPPPAVPSELRRDAARRMLAELTAHLSEVDASAVGDAVSPIEDGELKTNAMAGRLSALISVDTTGSQTFRTIAGVVRSISEANDVVILELDQKMVKAPAWIRPAIDHILSASTFSVEDIAARLDPESAKVLIRRFVREGIVSELNND